MSNDKPISPVSPSPQPGTPIKKSPTTPKPVKPVPSSVAPGTPQKFSENG